MHTYKQIPHKSIDTYTQCIQECVQMHSPYKHAYTYMQNMDTMHTHKQIVHTYKQIVHTRMHTYKHTVHTIMCTNTQYIQTISDGCWQPTLHDPNHDNRTCFIAKFESMTFVVKIQYVISTIPFFQLLVLGQGRLVLSHPIFCIYLHLNFESLWHWRLLDLDIGQDMHCQNSMKPYCTTIHVF